MTQASNLANFANNLNAAGQADPNALSSVVPIAKGGTNANTPTAARANLDVPKRDGTDATGDWAINSKGTKTTNWTVLEINNQLVFQYNGVTKFTMDTSNGFTSL